MMMSMMMTFCFVFWELGVRIWEFVPPPLQETIEYQRIFSPSCLDDDDDDKNGDKERERERGGGKCMYDYTYRRGSDFLVGRGKANVGILYFWNFSNF